MSALGKRIAGIAAERQAPAFATETLRAWWQRTRSEDFKRAVTEAGLDAKVQYLAHGEYYNFQARAAQPAR